jgi:putative hemolysin
MSHLPSTHFDIVKLSYATKDDPFLKRLFINSIELATGRKRLEKIYQEVVDLDLQGNAIWAHVLDRLRIKMNYSDAQLQKISKEGPLVFIANHPFGVIDGIMICHLVSQVRPAYFLLANSVLCQENRIAKYFLPIDFEPTKAAMQTNIDTRKKSLEKIQQGESLVIFPAGGVATSKKFIGKAEDLEWKRFVVKIIHQTKATVVPIFFHGQNSSLFQIASHIHPSFRLSLFLHEVNNKIGNTFQINIGDPIGYEGLSQYKDRQELLDYLRHLTFELGK